MKAFRGLVRKEVLHIVRDRRTLLVLLLLPVAATLLFGYAVRMDVDRIRIAIVDPEPDPATWAVRNRFSATELHEVVTVLRSTESLDHLFRRGEVQQAIVFEADFARRRGRGEPARIQVITDATDPHIGEVLNGHALAVIRGHAPHPGAPATAGGARVLPQTELRFNPTMESTHLFVPGLVAFVLTIVGGLMTAISLTREREVGTMEAMLVSPLRPGQIILGKVLPYLVLGFVNAVTMLALARIVFGVPIRGSVVLLLGQCLLYVLTALAIGVLISTRTTSQRVAMLMALAGMLLPTMILSGFIFPIESMPAPLQLVSNAIPAKWFLEIIRGIMIKGAGLDLLWRETLILAAMTAAALAVGVRGFRIRLE